MSWNFPELVIESIIRDGIKDLKDNPTFIDQIFAQLDFPYAQRKYGTAEITKIKDLFTGANNTEIAIVFSFYDAAAKSPCISIQLGSTSENIPQAHIGDYEEQIDEPLTAGELSALEAITGLLPTAYTTVTGKVSVENGVDLTLISKGFIYKDGSNIDHVISSGISNVTNDKFFFIAPNATPNIGVAGTIRSPLTTKVIEENGVSNNVQILLGIHSKEPLLTIYLFSLVQFFLLSRKKDLVNRNFINSTLSGSDFTRNAEYQGDRVFTRFLTISGQVRNSWRSDIVNLIDTLEVTGVPIEC